MSSCPNCHNPIEITDKHLGTLYTCSSCNAVFFVDWSGQPELAQHEPQLEPQHEPQHSDFSQPTEFQQAVDFNIPSEEVSSNFEEPAYFESPVESSFVPEESSSTDSLESYVEETIEPADISNAPMPQFSSEAFGEPSNLIDISEFANADNASGGLTYSVIISNIDSIQIRNQIKEALADARFVWDADEILGRISSGVVEIHQISPVKASILINRIKYLPIKMIWRQNVFRG